MRSAGAGGAAGSGAAAQTDRGARQGDREPRRLETRRKRGNRGARGQRRAGTWSKSGAWREPQPRASASRRRSGVTRSGPGSSRLDGATLALSRPALWLPLLILALPETSPPRWAFQELPGRAAPTMRLNSSAPGPRGQPGANSFPLPPRGLEGALLALGFRNGSGNASEHLQEAPSSDLDVNTDIYSKVLVTAVYLVLFVVGTVGNSVTAFTLARKKSLQSLQSTVHYHLGSLALSDLLILVLAMPVELYNFIWVHHPWAFGDAVCRGYYFLRDACTYATALNVASLSVERYLAICHPFKAKTLMSRGRTKKFISAVWLASGLLAVPMLFTMGQQNRSTDGQHPGGLVCTPIVGTATIKVIIQVSGLFRAEGQKETGLSPGSVAPLREASGLAPVPRARPGCVPSGCRASRPVNRKCYPRQLGDDGGTGGLGAS